jgi:hypothetical protein
MRVTLDKQQEHVTELLLQCTDILGDEGKDPFSLDSKAPTVPLEQYAYNETRYRMLLQSTEYAHRNLRRANVRHVATGRVQSLSF